MANGDTTFPRWFWPVLIGVAIGILLLVILLPISFSYLDFYHYGFIRRHTTGRVSLDRVYTGGRYFIGPDFHFKKFKATAHHVNFNSVSVFTTDNLEVHLPIISTCSRFDTDEFINNREKIWRDCKKEEKGFFAEVRYLQLHDIDVPERVMERCLLGLVRDLEKECEEYLNQEALVRINSVRCVHCTAATVSSEKICNADSLSLYLVCLHNE